MRAVVPLLLIGLAACYSPRQLEPLPSPGYGYSAYEPLEASLFVDPFTAQASVDLSRPAHVAIFHFHPGYGFTMTYPAIGQPHGRYLAGGRHHLWTSHARQVASARAWSLGSHAGSRSRARYAATHRAHFAGGPGAHGPSYYVLIASDEPLEINGFYATGRALWQDRVSWSYNPYTASELLASRVVPRPTSTNWTVAYQVVWFHQDLLGPNYRMPRYTWVVCPGGYTVAVPIHLLPYFSCPAGTERIPEPVVPPGDTATATLMARVRELVDEERRSRPGSLGEEEPGVAQAAELALRLRQATVGGEAGSREVSVPTLRRPTVGEGEAAGTPAPLVATRRPVIQPSRIARPGEAEQSRATPAGTLTRQASDRPLPATVRPRAPGNPGEPQAERVRPQTERQSTPTSVRGATSRTSPAGAPPPAQRVPDRTRRDPASPPPRQVQPTRPQTTSPPARPTTSRPPPSRPPPDRPPPDRPDRPPPDRPPPDCPPPDRQD